MKKIYLIATIALALLAVGQTAQAYVLQSCDSWATYSDGTYTFWNNVWGAGAGTQCCYVTSATSWFVQANHPGGSGVKAYPNTSRSPYATIGNISSCSSSMSTSGPGAGTYNTSWDLWAPGEVMIWINRYGGASPWGSYVTTATVGGQSWDIYKDGYPGYIRTSNTNSLTVDIKAILNDCISRGWLSSSNQLQHIGGGFEIYDSSGATRTYTMNSFSASCSTGGTTTTTTTTAAGTTTTTTAAGTTTTTAAGGCTVTPYVQVNNGSWQQTTNVTVSSGATVKFGPQPLSGGTWSWSGCGTSGTSREQTVYPTSSCNATATFHPSGGGSCSATFYVTVQ